MTGNKVSASTLGNQLKMTHIADFESPWSNSEDGSGVKGFYYGAS